MTDNVKVAISSDFLTAFARLPRQVQGKVTEFVNKFRNNPRSPGINYEKLNSGIDRKIFSVRIDDTYRGIVVRQQEAGVYLLLWVDHHDEAYQWAARKRCEVNPQTGTIQVFDVQTVVGQTSTPKEVALFALANDDDLLKLGVPEEQLDLVRSFISKEDFYKAEPAMPHDAYRLIRALAGEEHPNDIFIVGDSHQRIYRNHPTLSKCGINVRGRSSILKINYRTTEEIRKYAFALLNGISFDDLDENSDLGDKCQSLTHGEKPIVENFENANDEFDFLLHEVKKLKENGISLTDICVVARTKKLVDDYIALFTKAGICAYVIKRNKVDDRSFDGLRVATMHRVKGLEFKYVFIVAANSRIIPLPSAINKTDPVSEVESVTSEKCLLYVAMTRAQKGVYITSYGRKSVFLKS